MHKFTRFINYALKILFIIIVMSSILNTCQYNKNDPSLYTGLVFIGIWAALVFLFLRIKQKVNFNVLFGGIIVVSLCIRILWFLNIDSLPVSDFGMMFYAGGQFIQGNVAMFEGINYFARFPHMSLTVMYFGLIQYLFSDPLSMTRVINIGFSTINVVLLYFIACQIFRDRLKSLSVMLIAALYPPMIYYNNVFASENLAMPLFLLSILFYLKAVNNKKISWFICSGICLSLTHLFRPIGYVVIVAYVLYVLIYYHQAIKAKLMAVSSIILSTILPFVLISILLVQMGITQYPLWHGTEPLSVSVLKGTNITSGGRWNIEDASVFQRFHGDYEAVDAECKRLIKERFKQTSFIEWVRFYIGKYGSQWSSGDFAGAYWAEIGRTDDATQSQYAQGIHSENKMTIAMHSQGFLFHQLVWIVILSLAFLGLFRNDVSSGRNIQLLYILFCGFALFFLITESQSRYSYIACWLFPILAVTVFRRQEDNATCDNPSERLEK